jgi:uncharacterized protein (TIGR02246 family)
MRTRSNPHVSGTIRVALAFFMLISLSLPAVSQVQRSESEDAVLAVIMDLEKTWNSGDMGGYLAHYRQDNSLSLTFGNTIVEGWTSLDKLFRKSYPDPERMGRFSIDQIQIQILSDDTAVTFGNFTHVFPTEIIKGGFTHVLTQGSSQRWLIQHERTSRGEVLDTH